MGPTVRQPRPLPPGWRRSRPGRPRDAGLQLLENSIPTGAALVALILCFQQVSAVFNRVVTLAGLLRGDVARRDAVPLMAAQVAGAIAGSTVANLMFDLSAVSIARHDRSGGLGADVRRHAGAGRCGRVEALVASLLSSARIEVVTTLSDFKATTLSGDEQSLDAYAGQVVVVVNTATECGFTPQLGGLEKLFEQYADQGFSVLGFPCNQFGGQEPREGDDIGAFCQKNYGVSFPMFDKIDVNGADAHPLFAWLKSETGGLLGEGIKWNFTKFLVGRDGKVVKRFGTTKSPESMTGAIEAALTVEA